MPFRFLHAADIHLDSPLRSLALRNPELADLVGNATRRAFTRIIDVCLEERVDALLLAGDLYDGDQTSMKTARFLADQIRKLHEAGIQVFIIRGNHDALSRITKELTFPDTIKLFGGRADAITIDNGALPITVHGLSFAQPLAPESLLARYKAPTEGTVNIGLMHTSLDGSPGHDPYAPCKLADLQDSGFRYWALGHIHRRSPTEGPATVVMPGMPQGRDINEDGAKSVTLVTVRDDATILIEERLTSIAQFERVPVALAPTDDWRDMVGKIARALERTRTAVPSEHLVARLRITGATPLAWRIRRDQDLLRTEAADQASMIGNCWIEGVELLCTPPPTSTTQAGDPIAELRRLIEDEIRPTDAFQTEAKAAATDLLPRLPQECRDLLGTDEATLASNLAALIDDGIEEVLARLHAPPDATDT